MTKLEELYELRKIINSAISREKVTESRLGLVKIWPSDKYAHSDHKIRRSVSILKRDCTDKKYFTWMRIIDSGTDEEIIDALNIVIQDLIKTLEKLTKEHEAKES